MSFPGLEASAADVGGGTPPAKGVVSDKDLHTPAATSCSSARSTSCGSMTPAHSPAIGIGVAVPEQEQSLAQVPAWPRTMSGDDLHTVTGIEEEPQPSMTSWPRTMSGENLHLLAGIEATPEKEVGVLEQESDPHPGFTVFPRTMSGDDLHSMTGINQQPLVFDFPRTMSGDNLHELLGGMQGMHPDFCLAAVATAPVTKEVQSDPYMGQQCMPPGPPPPPPQMAPTLQQQALPPPPSMLAAPGPPVVRVSLADALPEPELGTPDMPTMGSAGHRMGTCKPCAFLHTKGCHSGKDCTFCHLCNPGEKKRRQKEKKDVRKEMVRVGQVDGFPPGNPMEAALMPR